MVDPKLIHVYAKLNGKVVDSKPLRRNRDGGVDLLGREGEGEFERHAQQLILGIPLTWDEAQSVLRAIRTHTQACEGRSESVHGADIVLGRQIADRIQGVVDSIIELPRES
jgi:hypothetical protein